ncbi:hypothetical protein KIPB_001581 [Kipferlia bialata]|uniref:Uncharacterized protein n=1 Tax=Kipferlia bialata TaxID=797122 RepID=A0A9K3GG19_9EUKA|nr:hypothetical protein KIPB_001581 [Kipferlia bialata]|eukprot:g1581.t1
MTGPRPCFQCPCGSFFSAWGSYRQHAVQCGNTDSASVTEVSLPVFHDMPLCDVTERTIGYGSTTETLPGDLDCYAKVRKCLSRGRFPFRLYGSHGSVYATQSSDMDLALDEGTLIRARDYLAGCRAAGSMVIIGKPSNRSRRHLKVFEGPKQTGRHMDMVLSRDSDGPQRRQLLVNLATILPVMPLVKRLLKTLASLTGCLAPGTRGQEDHERNGSQLLDNAVWAVCLTIHIPPQQLVGEIDRGRLFGLVERHFDTSSVDTLMRGVMVAWCHYNRECNSRHRARKSVVHGHRMDNPHVADLPPAMQCLVEPLLTGLTQGTRVQELIDILPMAQREEETSDNAELEREAWEARQEIGRLQRLLNDEDCDWQWYDDYEDWEEDVREEMRQLQQVMSRANLVRNGSGNQCDSSSCFQSSCDEYSSDGCQQYSDSDSDDSEGYYCQQDSDESDDDVPYSVRLRDRIGGLQRQLNDMQDGYGQSDFAEEENIMQDIRDLQRELTYVLQDERGY